MIDLHFCLSSLFLGYNSVLSAAAALLYFTAVSSEVADRVTTLQTDDKEKPPAVLTDAVRMTGSRAQCVFCDLVVF